MMFRLPIRLILILGCLLPLCLTLPADAQSSPPAAALEKAIGALQKAEQLVTDDPEAALAAAKEARGLFKNLRKEMAAKLEAHQLTEAQLEQEDLNTRIADDLFKKGEIFHKAVKDKLARSQELRAQGDSAAAQNLEAVAQIEGRLALQNFVRSEIFSLKNQQLVFEALLKKKP